MSLKIEVIPAAAKPIVNILCDSGHKYQSTLFNRDWLASNHLNPDVPLESVLS